MAGKFFRPGVVALGLLGCTAAAEAQPPPAPSPPPPRPAGGAPQRQVIRWPGGWMYVDGPEAIMKQNGTKGSTNVVTDSANGVGNRIVIDNGETPGVTVLRNVRNGVGNSVTVTPKGPVIELQPPPAAYKGRATKFWTKKVKSEVFGCTMYWCPKTKWWFRYDKAADAYQPITSDDALVTGGE